MGRYDMTVLRQFVVLACNLAWWLSCLPGWVGFAIALRMPEYVQRRLLRRILSANRRTAWGVEACFADVTSLSAWQSQPVTDYADYDASMMAVARGETGVLTAGRVLLLEPTTGSTGRGKLIPYTAALQAEFRRAIDPWIGSLFWRHPGVLRGRHYWAISPSTPPKSTVESTVPIGFADDSEYLGPLQQRLAGVLFAVPPAVARVRDAASALVLTAFFLAAAPDLSLVSVWHPTFLDTILDALHLHGSEVVAALREGRLPDVSDMSPETKAALSRRLRPMPGRADVVARALETGDAQSIWPRLRVISCWDGGRASSAAGQLARRFPRVVVQGKGLVATEGVVSLPWGAASRKVAAVRSHVLEFEESGGRSVRPLWNVEVGREYTVLLTTGGGLYRYRLGDRVRCTGRVGRTPCLEFLGRDGVVCDLAGEKLYDVHVVQALGHADAAGTCAFAMLAPAHHGRGYLLFVDGAADADALAAALDSELRANYHYHHARAVGQLLPVAAVRVDDALGRFRAAELRRGMRPGAIKVPALDPRTDWEWIFVTQGTDHTATVADDPDRSPEDERE
jgi:hypothetical protein